jgi:undecaprenyl-diphosphatase
MSIFDAIILGLVEGITEFLPISSTGHMILTSYLLHGQRFVETPFVKTFEVVIQLGAILAAAILYWRRLFFSRRTLAVTIVAFVPTGILGFVLYKVVKRFQENLAIDLWALLIGGLLLIAIEAWLKRRDAANVRGSRAGDRAPAPDGIHDVDSIPYGHAASIGTFQSLSMIPGVSRSAATIMTGLLLSIDRKAIVEFSFILAIPTMLAASAYDLYKNHAGMTLEDIHVLAIGFVVAFVTAIAAIKWLLRFVQTHTFTAFGVYRIIAAVLFWLVVLR